MSKKKILLGLLAGALFVHAAKLIIDAGVFWSPKDITRSCESINGVPGPEDFAVSKRSKVMFISSDPRPNGPGIGEESGSIFALDLETKELRKVTSHFSFPFHPHGIGLFEDESETLLYVVSHRPEKSVVEVFQWEDRVLMHLRTIEDEKIVAPNDIALIGKDRFYLSLDHGSKNPLLMKLETYTRLGQGKVIYYQNGDFTTEVSSINFANGLALDERNGVLYLASMLGKKVLAYKVGDDKGLELLKTFPLEVAPDNLTLNEDGNLLIGAHAKLFSLQAHMHDHTKKSPFEVLKIVDPLGKGEVRTLLSNDGSLASGVSVALETGPHLYLGTIFQDQLLRCKR